MNKIEKLELKHICGYLPYGLKVISNLKTVFLLGTFNTMAGLHHGIEKRDIQSILDNGYNPLLLPLSALTEPLEDGTVPIVELAKICGLDGEIENIDFNEDGCGVEFKDEFVFAFVFTNKTFAVSKFDFHLPVINQLQLFEYLYSKHFDIFDLISSGLAIDKRTFKL